MQIIRVFLGSVDNRATQLGPQCSEGLRRPAIFKATPPPSRSGLLMAALCQHLLVDTLQRS
jgi:hypothetical protein